MDSGAETVPKVLGETGTVGDGVTMPLWNRLTILDSHVTPDVGINFLAWVGEHVCEDGVFLAVTGAITSVQGSLISIVSRVGSDCDGNESSCKFVEHRVYF